MGTLTAARRLRGASSRPLRVLVVDCDEASRTAIAAALEWDSCDALLAGSADEAVELAHQAKPDVIVLGASLARAPNAPLAMAALGHVPLVAFYDRSTSLPDADAVVPLPLDVLQLLATVRMLAARRAARTG